MLVVLATCPDYTRPVVAAQTGALCLYFNSISLDIRAAGGKLRGDSEGGAGDVIVRRADAFGAGAKVKVAAV